MDTSNPNNPIIYQNTPPKMPTGAHFSLIFFLYRLLIIFLILFIVYVVIQGVLSLTLNRPLNLSAIPINNSAFVPDTSPRVALQPADTTATVGSPVSLSVKYYTGQTTIQGVDLAIRYDPKLLSLDPKNFFQKANTFIDFPTVQADPNLGVIRISAIATQSQIGFNGGGTLGDITFQTKSPGNASVVLEFTPGGTAQTNLIELNTGKNILQTVQNATINIK